MSLQFVLYIDEYQGICTVSHGFCNYSIPVQIIISSLYFSFSRRKILEACRSIKLLFNEGRERASKALGFTKKLKIDLANAAKFKIDVELAEFLSMLEKTDHVQVHIL